jgi:uncharacterized integral membrane protein
MRYLFWIVTGLVGLVLADFAVSNPAPVDLGFWPSPVAVTMPFYLAAFLLLAIGFAAGWLPGFFKNLGLKRERRRLARRIDALEGELAKAAVPKVPAPGEAPVLAPVP